MARKSVVENRADLANMMAKIEAGKSQIKVGDAREFLKILIGLEVVAIVDYRKSILSMLRKEALEMAKQKKPGTKKF